MSPECSPQPRADPPPPPVLLLQLVLGVPVISSVGNLDFWLRLCSARSLPGAEQVLEAFPQQRGTSKAAHAAEVQQWNADLIRKVRDAFDSADARHARCSHPATQPCLSSMWHRPSSCRVWQACTSCPSPAQRGALCWSFWPTARCPTMLRLPRPSEAAMRVIGLQHALSTQPTTSGARKPPSRGAGALCRIHQGAPASRVACRQVPRLDKLLLGRRGEGLGAPRRWQVADAGNVALGARVLHSALRVLLLSHGGRLPDGDPCSAVRQARGRPTPGRVGRGAAHTATAGASPQRAPGAGGAAGSSRADSAQWGKRWSQGSTENWSSRSLSSSTVGSPTYWRPSLRSLGPKLSCTSSALSRPPAAAATLAFTARIVSLPSTLICSRGGSAPTAPPNTSLTSMLVAMARQGRQQGAPGAAQPGVQGRLSSAMAGRGARDCCTSAQVSGAFAAQHARRALAPVASVPSSSWGGVA